MLIYIEQKNDLKALNDALKVKELEPAFAGIDEQIKKLAVTDECFVSGYFGQVVEFFDSEFDMTQLHGISWHKAPKDYENPDRSFSNWNKVQGKGPKPNMYQGQIDRKTNKMDGRGILI